MAQTFRDCYRQEQVAGNVLRLTRFWGLILADLFATVCVEYWKAAITFFKVLCGLEKEFLMANSIHNLDVAYRTDIGARSNNEDNAISYVPQDPQEMTRKGALFIVADGMGGHARGEVASELAVNEIRTAYYQDTSDDIAEALQHAVEHANTLLYAENKKLSAPDEKAGLMATTCVAVVLKDDRIYVANAGDSFAYVIRADQVLQIAEDHSLVAQLIREGSLTKEEARVHPQRNVITRCLGAHETVDVYVASEPAQDGDILVLCTDGLHLLVNEEELRSIVLHYEPQESAQKLIERANELGSPDNVTALVVRVTLSSSVSVNA
jgi:serine/threonine protein phosphatase PrpC